MAPLDYKKAGVDINAGEHLIERLKSTIRKDDPNIIGGIGDFAALYKIENTILVAATDGVGTKLKIAFLTGKHDTVGIDLVAMNVNDVLTKGAKPLFFLDYFATGKLDTGIAEAVIRGIDAGCKEAGCCLIGGETAEMPDFYAAGEYDLAGFVVGAINPDQIINGTTVNQGDAIVGFPSSGIHSNGYSLVRKLFFQQLGMNVNDYVPECRSSLGEALLTPTRIYVKEILRILERYPGHIHGMAHITGGGFTNISRINETVGYYIERLPEPPPIFGIIQQRAGISNPDMYKTFNMGIGYIVVTDIPEQIIHDSSLSPIIIGYIDNKQRVEIEPVKVVFHNNN